MLKVYSWRYFSSAFLTLPANSLSIHWKPAVHAGLQCAAHFGLFRSIPASSGQFRREENTSGIYL